MPKTGSDGKCPGIQLREASGHGPGCPGGAQPTPPQAASRLLPLDMLPRLAEVIMATQRSDRLETPQVPVTRGTRLGAHSLPQWPHIHAALTQVRRLPSASSPFRVIPSAQRVSLHPWRLKSDSAFSLPSLWLSEGFPTPHGTRCSSLIPHCSVNSTFQLSESPPPVLPVPSPSPRADSGQSSFCPLTSPALASPSGVPADPFSGLLFHPHHPPAPWKVFS